MDCALNVMNIKDIKDIKINELQFNLDIKEDKIKHLNKKIAELEVEILELKFQLNE